VVLDSLIGDPIVHWSHAETIDLLDDGILLSTLIFLIIVSFGHLIVVRIDASVTHFGEGLAFFGHLRH
jgi:hypothetical protein